MGGFITTKSLETYLEFLLSLDRSSREYLISRLTDSLKVKREKRRAGLISLYGAWEDDKSTEEIISTIRESRKENRKIEDFE